jgi:hypothetical protein
VEVLRVTRSQRDGQDRLHVIAEDTGTRVAWYDRETGRIEIEDDWYRDAILDALAPYLRGTGTLNEPPAEAGTPATATPAHRRDEPSAGPHAVGGRPQAEGRQTGRQTRRQTGRQAARRPRRGLREQAAAFVPRSGSRLLSRLAGGPAEASLGRAGADTDEPVARHLARLARQGWRVLDDVQLAGGTVVDHLVIGPAGVFAVDVKRHPGAKVAVGARVVSVNGAQHPYMRDIRQEAAQVARLLSSACGFPVNVIPMLVFVGASSMRSSAPVPDVLVLRSEDIDRLLRRLPERLMLGTSERIFAAARREQTWLAGADLSR